MSYRNMDKLPFSVIILLATLLMFNYNYKPASSNQDLVNVNTKFVQEYYSNFKEITAPGSNFAFSPFGACIGIGVMSIIAKGNISQEIECYEMYLPANQSKLLEGFKNWLTTMGSLRRQITTVVFPDVSYPWDNNYTETAKEYFSAIVQPVNLSMPKQSAKEINIFMNKATKGTMKNIVAPDDITVNKTIILLVNTIYFKRKWENPFPAALTRKMTFHISSKETIKVDVMENLETYFPYGDFPELDAKILALPYNGNQYSLVIILPNKKVGLTDLEKKLDLIDLVQLQRKLNITKMNINIPKFRVDFKIYMDKPLNRSIFEKHVPDLNGLSQIPMAKERIYLSQIVQKVLFRVDEAGAEAGPRRKFKSSKFKSRDQEKITKFQVDHPFLFALQHSVNNTVTTLFFGNVMSPLSC